MYFATDGGIYRALDGYSGLTSRRVRRAATSLNSLNEKLGSMTQFVSFSPASDGFEHDPGRRRRIMGRRQPVRSQSSTGWVNVNAGDGGYNEINPDNPRPSGLLPTRTSAYSAVNRE